MLRYLSIIFCLIGLQIVINAQITYTIGSSSTTSSSLPIRTCNVYNYSQQIYTLAELNAAGAQGPKTISQVRFYYASSSTTSFGVWQNWTLYLGNTVVNSFNNNSSWISESEMTQVFNGLIPSVSSNSWFTINLDVPFFWDGQSNLVLAVDENSPSNICSRSFGAYSSPSGTGIFSIAYHSVGSYNPLPSAPPTANYSSSSYKSRLQLVMTPVLCSGIPAPGNSMANLPVICQGESTTLSLENQVLGSDVVYQWQKSIDGLSFQDMTGLTASTEVIFPDTTFWYRCLVNCGQNQGVSNPIQVIVNESPAVNNTDSYAICSGDQLNIVLSSYIASTFSWLALNNANVGGETTISTNSSTINNTLINNTNSIQTVTYTITPFSIAAGCPGSPFTLTVSVVPAVTVSAVAPVTVCNNVPLNIALNANVPSSFSWSTSSNTNVTGESTTPVNSSTINDNLSNTSTSLQTLTYSVTPTSSTGSCPGSPINVTVNLVPTVNVTSSNTTTLCSGIPLNFNLTANVGSTFSWQAANNPNTTGESLTATSSATIANTIISNSSSAQNVVYTVTPTSTTGNCLGVAQTLTVNVNPTPAITAANTTICSGQTFTVTPTTTNVPVGTTYSWSAPTNAAITSGLASGTAQANISGTLISSSSSPTSVTYVVTPTSNLNCTGASFNVVVNINPKPNIGNLTATICSGNPFSVTPNPALAGNNIPTGTSYTWTAPTGAGFSGGATQTNGQSSISQILTNNTVDPVTASYSVTPSTTFSCPGTPFNVVVTINPAPTVNFTPAPQTICSGTAFNTVTLSTTTANPEFSWTAVTNGINGVTTSGNTGTIASETFTNPTNAPLTVVYTASAQVTGSGCAGVPATYSITVNPTPIISIPTQTICSGTAFSVNPLNGSGNIVPANTSYTWPNPAAPASITGESSQSNASAPISQVLTNLSNTQQTATYTITPTTALGCSGSAFTLNVNVNPTPVIPAQALTVCGGLQTALSLTNNQPTTILPNNTTFSWSVPGSLISLTGASAGNALANFQQTLTNTSNITQTATYSVTPATSACTGATFNVVITVNSTPVVSNVAQTICSGMSFSIAPVTSIIPIGTKYSWTAPTSPNELSNYSSGSNQSTINGILYNSTNIDQTAVFNVIPISENGCTGVSFSLSILVHPTPQIQDVDFSICSGEAFYLEPSTITGSIIPFGVDYTWSVQSTLEVNGSSEQLASSFGVNYSENWESDSGMAGWSTNWSNTISNPCQGNRSVRKNISSASTAGSFLSPMLGISNGELSILTFDYKVLNFSGGQGASSSFGSIQVQYSSSSNGPWSTMYIINNTNHVASNTCINKELTFTPSAGNLYIRFNCNYGTGNYYVYFDNIKIIQNEFISQNLTNISNQLGTVIYDVTPTSIQGCVGENFEIQVDVNPVPVVVLLEESQVICSGNYYDDISLSSSSINVNYNWSGTTDYITGATMQGMGPVIYGQTLINLTNEPQILIYSIIPYISGSNCFGAAIDYLITVNPTPTIENTTSTVCSGLSFTYNPTDNLNNIVPISTAYSWQSPVSSGLVTGGTAQEIGVFLISQDLFNLSNTTQSVLYEITPNSNGCIGNSFSLNIEIFPTPDIINEFISICSNEEALLTQVGAEVGSIWPDNTFLTWFVNEADAGVIGITELEHQVSFSQLLLNNTNVSQLVTYNVTTQTEHCVGNVFQVVVNVNPRPNVNSAEEYICSGSSFNFSPQGTSLPLGTLYSWGLPNSSGGAIGIGTGLLQSTISGIFNNTTAVTQSLDYFITPMTSAGCIGNEFVLHIVVLPIPIIASMNSTVCSGDYFAVYPSNITIGNIIPAGTTYTWSFPISNEIVGGSAQDVEQSLISQLLINPDNEIGSIVYSISPTTSFGCTGPAFNLTVSVFPSPDIEFSISDQTICSGSSFLDVGLSSSSSNVEFQWNIDTSFITGFNGNNSGDLIQGLILNNPTNLPHEVTFTVSAAVQGSGCFGIPSLYSVLVIPNATVTTQNSESIVCQDGETFPICFDIQDGVGIPNIEWYQIDNSNSSEVIPIVNVQSNCYTPNTSNIGNYGYFIELSYSSGGCVNVTSPIVNVTVVSDPQIISQPVLSQTICQGALPVALSVNVSGGVGDFSYQWFNAANGDLLDGQTSSVLNLDQISDTGNYIYIAEITQDGEGCEILKSDTANIIVLEDPHFSAQFNVNQLLCFGGLPSTLSVTLSGGLEPQYQWYTSISGSIDSLVSIPGATNSDYLPSSGILDSSYYYCEVTSNGNGCGSPILSSPFLVSVLPQPMITSEVDTMYGCVGYVYDTLSASGNLGSFGSFVWYESNTNGNYDGDVMNTAIPNSSILGSETYYTIYSSWVNGCTADTSGFYIVDVKDTPIIEIYTNDSLLGCAGAIFPMGTIMGVSSGYDYQLQWSIDGDVTGFSNGTFEYDTPEINGIGEHHISVTMIDEMNNCDFEITKIIPVEIVADPTISEEINFNQTICPYSSDIETLMVHVNYAGLMDSLIYTWYYLNDSDTALVSSNETYSFIPNILEMNFATHYWCVVNSSENGCSPVSSQISDISFENNSSLCIPDMNIPDAFSPNQDGFNDSWEIQGIEELTNYEVRIWNVLGQLIYFVKDSPPEWDGTWDGALVPSGDYYYSISMFNSKSIKYGVISVN